jgi:TetR/AcrR family transcriptional repressor of nem operon
MTIVIFIVKEAGEGNRTMRVSREQAQATRKRIVDTAGRMFREKGIHAVGLDAIMKEAGLTHGGFYGHFRSKDELVAEAIGQAMGETLKADDERPTLKDFVDGYLSSKHRDESGAGCPIAALGPELARLPDGKRGFATDYVRALIAKMEELRANSGRPGRQEAIAELASLVGALIMARAVDDAALSDEILSATRRATMEAD